RCDTAMESDHPAATPISSSVSSSPVPSGSGIGSTPSVISQEPQSASPPPPAASVSPPPPSEVSSPPPVFSAPHAVSVSPAASTAAVVIMNLDRPIVFFLPWFVGAGQFPRRQVNACAVMDAAAPDDRCSASILLAEPDD